VRHPDGRAVRAIVRGTIRSGHLFALRLRVERQPTDPEEIRMESSSQDARVRRDVAQVESDVYSVPVQPRDATTRHVVREVQARLRQDGIVAALGWLNARTRFRFTGLYRAEPPVLRNLYLVDRENPTLNVSGEICPLDETYCSITFARDAAFATSDARRDERLVEHPARRSVISYVGVPVRLGDGAAWGTLCHYDLRPRLLPPTELVHLDAVASVFGDWLSAHGAA
jgi:GAF domain-containing protein